MGSKSLTLEEFIQKAKKVHGHRYVYDNVYYINNHTKINILCKQHGEFWQTPGSHLNGNGCMSCGRSSTLKHMSSSTKTFVKKAKKIHKYDYSKVNYITAKNKVEIVCKKHGSFLQTPDSHLRGSGCPHCSNIKAGTNATGWTKTKWYNSAKISNNYDSFKTYIVKLYNDKEVFYKIGRTFTKIDRRFWGLPYYCEVVKIYEFKELTLNNSIKAFDMENKLKNDYKNFKYIPKIKFKGMQECYTDGNR